MAYDKHTWTCDEPITVERLNHIEDGIANAGGECGYECEEGRTTLTEESVTTSLMGSRVRGLFSYTEPINANSIVVTFNGTEYECDRRDFLGNNGYIYGGEYSSSGNDFSTYPFIIISTKNLYDAIENALFTETAGTYTVKIEIEEEIVTTTPCFDKARGYSCGSVTLTEETLTATLVE